MELLRLGLLGYSPMYTGTGTERTVFFQTPAAETWLEHRIAPAHAARLVNSFVGRGLFHPRIPRPAMLTQDEIIAGVLTRFYKCMDLLYFLHCAAECR